jgi:hypothetical protein
MLTLANSLPWYLWALWGTLGAVYIISWVIKSTKNDPVMWRIGWLLLGIVIGGIVTIDNLIKGQIIYLNWWPMVMGRALPLVILSVALTYIGGYQKIMRPGYDPEKRRTALMCSYALGGIFIVLGLFFGGFYIYDNFFK